MSSIHWYTEAFGDYLLIEALNQSIDRTIDEVIIRERFEDALPNFLRMNDISEKNCLSRAIFPCSSNRKKQQGPKKDCYFDDVGCGYIDALILFLEI